MKHRIKSIIEAHRNDYLFSTTASSALSALVNTAFTIFNGVLGIVYHSLWNGTICVYYLLLAIVRTIIIMAQRKESVRQSETDTQRRRRICTDTHLLLLLMDISLVIPIIVMVNGERRYTFGLIPAIAMAAYTTYRITMGIIHYRKSRKDRNPLVSELRMINLTDALLALLTLQNTLIIANGGMSSTMKTLSAWTSTGIFAVIVFITIRSFLKAKRVR